MYARPRARLALCLLLGVIAAGSTTASASAAPTLDLTLPADPHAGATSTITASGELDDPSYVIVDAELNGTACTGGGQGSNATRLDVQQTSAGGSYSKQFSFHPTTPGSYQICGYAISKTDGQTKATTAATLAVGAAQASVTTTSAASISSTAATLRGGVSSSEATDWHFEYGTSMAGGQSTPTRTQPANAQNGAVAADVTLAPSTTYFYRTVASNSGGTVEGAWVSFTTPSASSQAISTPATRYADETWPLTLSGSAGSPSYFAVYLERNGSACGATIDEESSHPASALGSNGTLGAGSYSTGAPMASVQQQAPGTYLVCAYLVPQDRHGHTEASASTTVTVSERACPSIDFPITAEPSQAGHNTGDLDVVVPADGVDGVGVVNVVSSDGGAGPEGEEFPGEYRFEVAG